MNMSYDQITAQHYASYRPSLHIPILQKCLENEKRLLGLDIGCGTGQSAIALTYHCNTVIGIDSSAAMLAKTSPHPNITYKRSNGKTLEFKEATFDIITLAGVLHYVKSQTFLDEITRVAKKKAKVVVYDFALQLQPVLIKLQVSSNGEEETGYNHQANFSGLVLDHIKLVVSKKEEMVVVISPENLAHLLLSSKVNYALLGTKMGYASLYDTLYEKLKTVFETEKIPVRVQIFYSTYELL